MASIDETGGSDHQDSLEGAVAVVTGATGGIGRQTANELARLGARLVISSRSEEQLERVAAECAEAGASATVVPADVTKPHDVRRLAKTAVQTHGRIDLWVNCAAVALFARFGEEPAADYLRVVETNLFGCINSARECLPHFRHQARGTMVNVLSVHSRLPAAYLSSYAVANAGIQSLAASLRTELTDVPEVRVCNVVAGATDTALFRRAGNYTGQSLANKVTVHRPQEVARAVVECAQRPRDEMMVSLVPRIALLAGRVFPRMVERGAKRATEVGFLTGEPAGPTSGNLFEPSARVDVGRARNGRSQSPPSRAVAVTAATAGAGVLACVLLRGKR